MARRMGPCVRRTTSAHVSRRTDSRPMPRHRVDKPVAGIGMALPARLQHVAQQEQPGQPKTVLQVLVGPAVRAALAFAQERRQPQQPVAPGLAGRAATPRRRISARRRSGPRSRRSRRNFPDRARSRVRPASPARTGPDAPRPRRRRRNHRACAPASRRCLRADRAPATAAPARPDGSRHRPRATTPAGSPRAAACPRSRNSRDARRAAPATPRVTLLPGCSSGRIREPAPPRTRPRWRPCSRVSSSTMAEDSPCRRTPSTMPSSVHSMGGVYRIS